MADTEIEVILRDLLARRDLSQETREELAQFHAESRADRLDPDDRRYIVALARRLGAAAAAAPATESESGAAYDEEHSWRERAQAAEQRAAAAEARFAAVKEAFERLYGPAAIAPGPEAEIRRAVYDAFRREIERIEAGEG
ncbi:MAG: hypothetical protein IRY94_11995 [Rhodospirillaceae bacterium]|nr:hypothetical protein [Rhodospirillaceae bacterium]